MSLLTRAGDLVYTFRFLKLLVTKFEDTDAYKRGIIDADGKRIKSKKLETGSDSAAYTPFHRLVFNIKKLLAKAPGGSSRLASYAAALFLLKEKFDISDKQLEKILKESGLSTSDIMAEATDWYVLDDGTISPGIYRIKNSKCINDTLDELVNPKDKITIADDCQPVGEIFGLPIYEGIHINTQKKLYFTLGEIYK